MIGIGVVVVADVVVVGIGREVVVGVDVEVVLDKVIVLEGKVAAEVVVIIGGKVPIRGARVGTSLVVVTKDGVVEEVAGSVGIGPILGAGDEPDG